MEYIVPHRPSSEDRETALKHLLVYLDDKPVRTVIVEDDGNGLFNRGQLLNKAVRKSNADIVWLADNDIIVDPASFSNAPDILSDLPIYKPFHKRIYDVNLDVYQRLAAGETTHEDYPLRKGLGLFSGVTAIKRDSFLGLGGFDEAFEGWGGEDYALARVAHVLQIQCLSDDLPAYHFSHKKLPADTPRHPHYAANRELWFWYRSASEEEIKQRVAKNIRDNTLKAVDDSS